MLFGHIYHHNDMDGHAGATIASYPIYKMAIDVKSGKYSPSESEEKILREYATRSIFSECDYASHAIEPPIDDMLDMDALIVDLSFSEKTMCKLVDICKKYRSVTWLDHHTSSVRLVEKHEDELKSISNLKYCVDESRSGAMIAWDYLYGNVAMNESGNIYVPTFVKLVDDYDRWVKALEPDTTYFKIGIDMNTKLPSSEVWNSLMTDSFIESGLSEYAADTTVRMTYMLNRIKNDGIVAKKYIDCNNDLYYRTKHFISNVFGVPCDCVNAFSNSWIFGDHYPEYKLHCVFSFNGDVWTYSLYSEDPEIDCSAIAESYGGGGHKGAAGFSAKVCIFSQFDQ